MDIHGNIHGKEVGFTKKVEVLGTFLMLFYDKWKLAKVPSMKEPVRVLHKSLFLFLKS